MSYSTCIIFILVVNLRMQSDSGNESAGTEDDDDVIFHVGSETVMRIPARRSVLSKKNEVFRAMFCGPYTQARENLRRRQAVGNNEAASHQNHLTSTPDHIYDPDVDGRAFKNLIRLVNNCEYLFRSIDQFSILLQFFVRRNLATSIGCDGYGNLTCC